MFETDKNREKWDRLLRDQCIPRQFQADSRLHEFALRDFGQLSMHHSQYHNEYHEFESGLYPRATTTTGCAGKLDTNTQAIRK